jgi:hypothetical protein
LLLSSFNLVSALTRLISEVYASRQDVFPAASVWLERRIWLQKPISDR